MKMNTKYGKVYDTYSIFHLNTAFAWEIEYYVNVWTSPRKWAERGGSLWGAATDPEANAANFYMKYRRGADYVSASDDINIMSKKCCRQHLYIVIRYTMFLILRT